MAGPDLAARTRELEEAVALRAVPRAVELSRMLPAGPGPWDAARQQLAELEAPYRRDCEELEALVRQHSGAAEMPSQEEELASPVTPFSPTPAAQRRQYYRVKTQAPSRAPKPAAKPALAAAHLDELRGKVQAWGFDADDPVVVKAKRELTRLFLFKAHAWGPSYGDKHDALEQALVERDVVAAERLVQDWPVGEHDALWLRATRLLETWSPLHRQAQEELQQAIEAKSYAKLQELVDNWPFAQDQAYIAAADEVMALAAQIDAKQAALRRGIQKRDVPQVAKLLSAWPFATPAVASRLQVLQLSGVPSWPSAAALPEEWQGELASGETTPQEPGDKPRQSVGVALSVYRAGMQFKETRRRALELDAHRSERTAALRAQKEAKQFLGQYCRVVERLQRALAEDDEEDLQEVEKVQTPLPGDLELVETARQRWAAFQDEDEDEEAPVATNSEYAKGEECRAQGHALELALHGTAQCSGRKELQGGCRGGHAMKLIGAQDGLRQCRACNYALCDACYQALYPEARRAGRSRTQAPKAKQEPLSITLRWDTKDEFDLIVKLPNGEELRRSSPSAGGGQLAFQVHGIEAAWPGGAPDGEYAVRVEMLSLPSLDEPVPFVVRVTGAEQQLVCGGDSLARPDLDVLLGGHAAGVQTFPGEAVEGREVPVAAFTRGPAPARGAARSRTSAAGLAT